MDQAVLFQQVGFELERTRILRNLSFDVREGETFALFGPSGCGKSTTLRLVSGLACPTNGSVLVFGRDAASYSHQDRCVATVWQGKALFPHMNVGRNLDFGLRNRGLSRGDRDLKVREISKRLGIEALLKRGIMSLSGGEQQRVALGRAMVIDPRVLLLDEPFTGLDQILRWQLLSDLRNLLSQGDRTYILVSHEFETILALADRAAVMRSGSIVQIGTPDAIWQLPASGFVARLIGWSNVFPARAVETNGDFAEVEVGKSKSMWAGRLAWASGNGEIVGREATYVLHPHEVELGSREECRAEGSYLGRESRETDYLLFFQLEDIGVLRMRSPREGGPLGLSPGMKVPLSWKVGAALVLPP